MPLDPLAKITYGLFVAATKDGSGRDVGCIVNTACQVTVTPTMVSLTVNKMNYTAGSIEASGVFTISMLDTTADFDLIKNFGFQSSKDVDKFKGFETARAKNGVVYLTKNVCAYLGCSVKQVIDLGTHLMFIGLVEESGNLSETEPLRRSFPCRSSWHPQPLS